jgi:hypothetical protein
MSVTGRLGALVPDGAFGWPENLRPLRSPITRKTENRLARR